jgi:hypothetical protein
MINSFQQFNEFILLKQRKINPLIHYIYIPSILKLKYMYIFIVINL